MSGILNDGIFTATAPLRIPIAGGGTDLPEYSDAHGGYWLSLSIDKNINVVLHKNFENTFFIHYKNSEKCQKIDEINHPIIREMLKDFNINETLSVHSISEVAGNSGLGSSSTFALCLTKVLSKISNSYIPNMPEYVYNFERNILQEFVGRQDAWAGNCGGLKVYSCSPEGFMEVKNLIGNNDLINLSEHLLLVKAGKQRFANEILKKQAAHLKVDQEFIDKFHKTKELAYQITDLIKASDITGFGLLVDKHWQNKLSAFKNAFDTEVFEVYNELKKADCVGAKLCGAGNSGYMLAIFPSQNHLNNFILNTKHTYIKVKPDFIGLR